MVKKGTYIRVSPDLHKAVKVEAATREMDMGELVETAFRAWLSPPKTETPVHGHVKTDKDVSLESLSSDTLLPTEASEWSRLAEVASTVVGPLERSMYRSIRFQIEYLALVALRQQEDDVTELPIRFGEDGELVQFSSDPSSPFHRTARKREAAAEGGGGKSGHHSVVSVRKRR